MLVVVELVNVFHLVCLCGIGFPRATEEGWLLQLSGGCPGGSRVARRIEVRLYPGKVKILRSGTRWADLMLS